MRVAISFAPTNYFDTTKIEARILLKNCFGHVTDMTGQVPMDEI